ncbi:MAG TPA: hypothetical protein DEQ34_07260 [Balneolaceae bacterium]|nr:hypothetical protein [Balneolaceae bacterium]|tara:strand:+ start:14211 stop:14627 length:417 start_codon:yes stop_codon:yes gene_type:complete
MFEKNRGSMKTAFPLLLTLLFISGCDPVSLMDATITNSTSQELTVIFAASSSRSDTLYLSAGQTVLFQDGMSTTGSYLEPNLEEYDSVIVSNNPGQTLSVYLSTSEGKNIYKMEDWSFKKPDDRMYKYDFELTNEDVE